MSSPAEQPPSWDGTSGDPRRVQVLTLAMLNCPEFRRSAGLPLTGPLTFEQISICTGIPISTLHGIYNSALRKMRERANSL